MRTLIIAAVIVTLSAPLVAGEAPAIIEKYDPAAVAKSIAPYLDAQAMLFARIDVSRIDVDAAVAKLMEIADPIRQADPQGWAMMDQGVGATQAEAKKWIADFTAAGGREVYIILDLTGLPHDPLIAIAPLSGKADTQTVANLLKYASAEAPESGPTGRPFESARIKGNVVFAGGELAMQRIDSLKPIPRPQLTEAFAAAGDGAIQILFMPNEMTRRVIAEMMPTLPEELGGGPSSVLFEGVKWAAFGASISPQISLRLTVQSTSPQAADALSGLIDNFFNYYRPFEQQMTPRFDMKKAIALVTPKRVGDRLELFMNEQRIDKLMNVLLADTIANAQKLARRAVSQSQILHFVLSCNLYLSDHKHWPKSLEELVKYNYVSKEEETFANPNRPQDKNGYVYIRPLAAPDRLTNILDTIVIYEKFDQWGEGISVGFADAHVEFIADRARFDKLLAGTIARNKAAAEKAK